MTTNASTICSQYDGLTYEEIHDRCVDKGLSYQEIEAVLNFYGFGGR